MTENNKVEQVHERLSDYGLKEFKADTDERQYYEGYCDALEWVCKEVLDAPEAPIQTSEEDKRVR